MAARNRFGGPATSHWSILTWVISLFAFAGPAGSGGEGSYDQEDHQTGRDLSRQAMEYSARAHQYSQEAYEKSEGTPGKAGKAVRIEPVKRANDVGKQNNLKR